MSNKIARERKPCESCGFVRLVKIWPAMGSFPASWKRECTICKLRRQAKAHRDVARRMEQKADTLQGKRKQ